MKNEPGQPQYIVEIETFELLTTIPKETFIFNPPSGARLVPFDDLAGNQGEEQ
jgi:hypothetical protein